MLNFILFIEERKQLELSSLHVLDVAIIKFLDCFYAMLYVCMVCVWISIKFQIKVQSGVDVLKIFKIFSCRRNKELIKELSMPALGTQDLFFPTQYCQSRLGQFKYLLWKQNLTYWRSPGYNLVRFAFTFVSGLIFGTIFWDLGTKV